MRWSMQLQLCGKQSEKWGMRSTVVGPYERQTMTEISLVMQRVNSHLKLKWLEDSHHGSWRGEETLSPLETLSPIAMWMVWDHISGSMTPIGSCPKGTRFFFSHALFLLFCSLHRYLLRPRRSQSWDVSGKMSPCRLRERKLPWSQAGGWVLSFIPSTFSGGSPTVFYRWGNWGPGRLYYLPRFTQFCVGHWDLSSVLSGSLCYRVSGHPMDIPKSPSHWNGPWAYPIVSSKGEHFCDLPRFWQSGRFEWFRAVVFQELGCGKNNKEKKSVTFMYNGQIGLLSMFYFSTVLRDPLA